MVPHRVHRRRPPPELHGSRLPTFEGVSKVSGGFSPQKLGRTEENCGRRFLILAAGVSGVTPTIRARERLPPFQYEYRDPGPDAFRISTIPRNRFYLRQSPPA